MAQNLSRNSIRSYFLDRNLTPNKLLQRLNNLRSL